MRLAIAIAAATLVATAMTGEAAARLFVELNAPEGNRVIVIRNGTGGSLTLGSAFETRGKGTGGALENQGALAVGRDGTRLYAVNAASNSISAFVIRRRGLRLFDRATSGGIEPVSLAAQDGRAYVLNAGEPGNVTGFDVSGYGGLKPLPGASRPISPNAGAAQVGFSPNGKVLVVSERLTHRLLTFPLSPRGPRAPSIFTSAKPRPFGFAFHRSNLVVSEAGADTNLGASSYRLGANRKLQLVSSPVFPGQRGACWTAITGDGRYAYVTNTGSDTITGMRLGRRGRMELLDPAGTSAQLPPMTRPTDVVAVGRYLYVVGFGNQTVSSFAIAANGTLTPVASVRVAESGAITGLVAAR